MKKTLALTLIASALGVALIGCNKSEEATTPDATKSVSAAPATSATTAPGTTAPAAKPEAATK